MVQSSRLKSQSPRFKSQQRHLLAMDKILLQTVSSCAYTLQIVSYLKFITPCGSKVYYYLRFAPTTKVRVNIHDPE